MDNLMQSNHIPRCRARVLLLGILLVVSLVICRADEAKGKPKSDRDQDQELSEQSNRQLFKVHLISSNKATSGKKLLPKLKSAAKGPPSAAGEQKTGGASAGPDESAITKLNKGQLDRRQQKGSSTTISNATLKKLLNQSLLKSNGSDNSMTPKLAKNFKFVFIQRATTAPHLSAKATPSSSPTETGSSPPTTTNDRQSSDTKSSLAASVSKQLATSLLNSAAGLVANLSGSSPSLSSLASQIVAVSAASLAGDPIAGQGNNSSSAADLSASESSETNRGQQVGSSESGPSIGRQTNTKKGKMPKSKPAKIYNLPVKFVANGQPNHVVVFHTLKEHFATIKRLQTMSSSLAAGKNNIKSAGSNWKASSSSNKDTKTKQRHKLKGTNSRLIYLPLRYLSNAKPNKLMISKNKATRK